MPDVHARHFVGDRRSVRVECDNECSVRLMDDENYANYIARKSFRYFGGLCRKGFPSLTKPPAAGDWNIVVTPIPATASLSPAIQIVDS